VSKRVKIHIYTILYRKAAATAVEVPQYIVVKRVEQGGDEKSEKSIDENNFFLWDEKGS